MPQVADYLAVTPSAKEVLKQRCSCCTARLITKHGRLCQKCWDRAGDISGPLSEDMAWQEGRKPIPDELIGGFCTAMRGSGSKSCTAFKALVSAHLPDKEYRLSAAQATRVQAELKAGSWCPLTELGVHNLMALPGEFATVLGVPEIHCYMGFKEDKCQSLKYALHYSTGRVPCKGSVPYGVTRCCKCGL